MKAVIWMGLAALTAFSATAWAGPMEDAAQALAGGDTARAATLYAVPAEAGDARAQTMAGVLAASAGDPAAGARWLEKAAEAGYPPARLLLGTMYLEGRGVPQDDKHAAHLFDQAAVVLREARFNVGVMIAAGRGFEVNPDGTTPFPDPDTGETYLVDERARHQMAFMTMVGAAMKGGLAVDVGQRMAAIMGAQASGKVVPAEPMPLIITFDDLVTDTPATAPFLADAIAGAP